MPRISISKTVELCDDGRFLTVFDHAYEIAHVPMRADRGVAKTAGANAGVAGGTAGSLGTQAQSIGGSIIPTLTRQAQGGGGLTPTQRNNYLVSGAEASGGTNAGVTGAANLASARTRNAGGFSAALDEAARQKMRTGATTAQNVNNLNTQVQQEQQQNALRQLQGLYGTDTSGMLQAMGIQNQDLATQLAAQRQGWVQNATGVIGALRGAGASGGGGDSGGGWAVAG